MIILTFSTVCESCFTTLSFLFWNSWDCFLIIPLLTFDILEMLLPSLMKFLTSFWRKPSFSDCTAHEFAHLNLIQVLTSSLQNSKAFQYRMKGSKDNLILCLRTNFCSDFFKELFDVCLSSVYLLSEHKMICSTSLSYFVAFMVLLSPFTQFFSRFCTFCTISSLSILKYDSI